MAQRIADRLPGTPRGLSQGRFRRSSQEAVPGQSSRTGATLGAGETEAGSAKQDGIERWLILLMLVFILSLFIPGSLQVGPVNMTFYRMVLIVACIPLGIRWITGQAGPITAVDLLFLASCLWISLALIMVHGLSRIIFIGTNFIELFGGYLMGRVLVRSVAGYRGFINACLLLLVLLLPIVVIEFLTGKHLLDMIFGSVMKLNERILDQRRMGFTRAGGPFAHPIHFGLFGTALFANTYFVFWRRTELMRVGSTIGVALTAMLSISSAALFSIALQTAMIVWERALIFLRSRWIIAICGGIALGIFLFVSVQGGLINYIVDNLIFARGAGEHRMDIYYYGTKAVLQRPFFGVGLNDWPRPFWREHPTINSFWLMTAVRHGIPGILFLMIGLVWGMVRITTARITDPDALRFRAGYMIALCGLILTLSTVHIWGSINVFVMAYFGAGSWFYTSAVALKAPPIRAAPPRAPRFGERPAETAEAGTPTPPKVPIPRAPSTPVEGRSIPLGLRGPIRPGRDSTR